MLFRDDRESHELSPRFKRSTSPISAFVGCATALLAFFTYRFMRTSVHPLFSPSRVILDFFSHGFAVAAAAMAAVTPRLENETSALTEADTAGSHGKDRPLAAMDGLTQALKAARIGCCDLDLVGDTASCDDYFREIFGLGKGGVVTASDLLSVVAAPADDAVRDATRLACEGGGEAPFKSRIRIDRGHSGAERWIEVDGYVVGSAGRPVRLIGLCRDVTADVSRELRLEQRAELAERLENIAMAVPGCIFSIRVREQGGASCVYASPSLADVFGFVPEAIAADASPLLRRIIPADRLAAQTEILACARAGKLWQKVFRYNHPIKGKTWIEAQSVPILQENGDVLWYSYAIDVTLREMADQALAESEERLRAVVDGAGDGIVTTDKGGRIESVNPAAERMFSWAHEELVGGTLLDLLNMPRNASLPEVLHVGRRLADVPPNPIEAIGRRKDGSTFPLQVTTSRVAMDGKQICVAFLRDLSEQKRAQAHIDSLRARQFEALRSLAVGLAHEIHQPLSASAAYLEAAQLILGSKPTLESANLQPILSKASAQVIRAGRIMSRLREFITRDEPDKIFLGLHEVIRATCDLMAEELRSAGVEVRLDLEAKSDRVLADRLQISQVLVNVMRNAAQAMGESTLRQLTISTRTGQGEIIELGIKDTGPGIAEKRLGRIFEPFSTDKAEGLGVGLHISRAIIESHDGRIWAESEPEGGAFFRIRLPLANDEEHE